MLGDLYAAGQTLFLIGLAWGAWLAISSSQTVTALRAAGAPHRRRKRYSGHAVDVEDPHASNLGYWP